MSIKHRLDLDAINLRTYASKDWEKRILESYKTIVNDQNREIRLKLQLCKRCFQGGKIAGVGFTQYVCGICSATLVFHNTAVPELCEDCSKTNDLCIQCAAHVDNKMIKEIK